MPEPIKKAEPVKAAHNESVLQELTKQVETVKTEPVTKEEKKAEKTEEPAVKRSILEELTGASKPSRGQDHRCVGFGRSP